MRQASAERESIQISLQKLPLFFHFTCSQQIGIHVTIQIPNLHILYITLIQT